MRRAILIVLDGCGVGAMPDADLYGGADTQSATLPHVAQAVGGLKLPTLERLGLGNVAPIQGIAPVSEGGAWGRLAEASAGKDSVTGHWEMMGIITQVPFPTYPQGFPADLIARFEARIGRETLGNRASSGTEILTQLGSEHVQTGKPIIYTSADSVFQVAAHEDVIPVSELYTICETAREMLVVPHNVQRVIARPFTGASSDYHRTENRRDYPLAPPTGNLLEVLQNAGVATRAIGVVADLFPRSYFAHAERTQNNPAHLAAILGAVQSSEETFIFANCEDFDMLFGHRNDPRGFARSLTEFDHGLAEIIAQLKPDDLLILTADHGNDPTTASTDHSREYVPLIITGETMGVHGELGTRKTFVDIAATIAAWLEVDWQGAGKSVVAP